MVGDGNKAANSGKKKGTKHKYLPHNKPVKKGAFPLRPGVEGFFITCDGGRERQAAHEAINVLDTFYEELVDGEVSATKTSLPTKPLNKITKFTDSDSSESEDDTHETRELDSKTQDKIPDKSIGEKQGVEDQTDKAADSVKVTEDKEPPTKKLRLVTCQGKSQSTSDVKIMSIDKKIEAELEELGDRSKRIFVILDSGCNGCVFIQMNKRAGDPGPTAIVQHMMKSAASTGKHMSRFILRVLPVEIACYASEEEITKAIDPLISQYFPAETQEPLKFAVLYEARANTGIDRTKIIGAVAKSVPQPHKVNLSSPDKTIVVQIAKTICMVSVIESYKQLSKFNLRQLASSKDNINDV